MPDDDFRDRRLVPFLTRVMGGFSASGVKRGRISCGDLWRNEGKGCGFERKGNTFGGLGVERGGGMNGGAGEGGSSERRGFFLGCFQPSFFKKKVEVLA